MGLAKSDQALRVLKLELRTGCLSQFLARENVGVHGGVEEERTLQCS